MTESEHEYFEQLCALVPTGQIPQEELDCLSGHLLRCEACRNVLAGYRDVCADVGAFHTDTEMNLDSFQNLLDDPRRKAATRERLMARLRAEDEIGSQAVSSAVVHARTGRIWPIAVSGLAAMALGVAVLWGWREHAARGVAEAESAHWRKLSRNTYVRAESTASELEAKAEAAGQALKAAQSQALGAAEVARREEVQWSEAEKDLQNKLAVMDRQSAALTRELEDMRSANASLGKNNDRLSTDLADSRKSVREAQGELARLSEARDREGRTTGTLQAQVRQLQDKLAEQSESVGRRERLLQTDRDIRDLMGARNLHVVDVFDVDTKGRVESPFGRVFYTEGKSLVFYAFDLGKQKGVRPVGTFQAWGESDQGGTSNLGIMYTDNVNQNRWMLQFDDPKVLADLQAVYVTIEPPGGSKQPSGRRLLVANLASRANHP